MYLSERLLFWKEQYSKHDNITCVYGDKSPYTRVMLSCSTCKRLTFVSFSLTQHTGSIWLKNTQCSEETIDLL